MKRKENIALIILAILAIIISSSIFHSNSASATYERVLPTDGLIAPWHPGSYCISCHYSLMDINKAQNISYSCRCHDYKPAGVVGYKVDMAKITDLHKDIICIRCHIGMKNQDNVSAADFHRIMPIACTNCHTYVNGTIQVPKKINCSDCHANGNPHVIHGDKVGELCVACHGEDFANKYANGTIVITENNISLKPLVVNETPTITDFIYRILKAIISGV